MSALTKLVAIVWDDAHASPTGEITSSTIVDHHGGYRLVTYGILVRDDEEGMSVVTEHDAHDGSVWRGHTFIPRGVIVDKWIVSHSPTEKGSKKGFYRSRK